MPLIPIAPKCIRMMAESLVTLLFKHFKGKTSLFIVLVYKPAFCYISDLIQNLIPMMNRDHIGTGGVNIDNLHGLTMPELAETILLLSNSKSKLVFVPLPSDDPKQHQPDIALAKAKLGWESKVNLEDGLKETISYFARALNV